MPALQKNDKPSISYGPSVCLHDAVPAGLVLVSMHSSGSLSMAHSTCCAAAKASPISKLAIWWCHLPGKIPKLSSDLQAIEPNLLQHARRHFLWSEWEGCHAASALCFFSGTHPDACLELGLCLCPSVFASAFWLYSASKGGMPACSSRARILGLEFSAPGALLVHTYT